jgi:uncharacterized protein YukE
VVAFRDLLDVSPGMFGEAAQRWQRTAEALRARAGDLDARLAGLSEWSGAAADAASSTFATYRKQLTDAADVLNRIPPVFHTAGPVVGDARSRLLHAVDEARSAGLEVNADTGQVTLSLAPANPRGADLSRQAEIQEWIDNALADATRADNEAADALRNLTAQYAGFAPDSATVAASATAIPPPGTAPAEVRKWWDALSPMQQESLLFTHEAQLGQLDGLPTPVRDRANRSRLAEQRARLEADQIRLTGRRDLTESERAQLDDINAKLNGIKSIELRLHTPDPAKQPAFLLGFDTTGTGRAIVAAGNPDTAVNVATYVPGTGANLGSIEGLMDRSDRMLSAAAVEKSPSTCVITWVGYNAPQEILDAGDADYADTAKKDLDRFQDGLRATHQGPPSHNTVLGHSYGSTVIGHTARDEGLNADEVVFVGSPGVGVANVADLHLRPEQVHATVADHDIIQLTNMPAPFPDPHGPSPTQPGFGATTFSSKPGDEGSSLTMGLSTSAHSQYWDPNNDSLRNFGKIIAGKPTY